MAQGITDRPRQSTMAKGDLTVVPAVMSTATRMAPAIGVKTLIVSTDERNGAACATTMNRNATCMATAKNYTNTNNKSAMNSVTNNGMNGTATMTLVTGLHTGRFAMDGAAKRRH